MKRSSIGAALAAAALLLGAAANAGSQTSAPTLSFLDATSQGTQHFLDNAPKSPSGNPGRSASGSRPAPSSTH